jgi:hypothetical protein
VKGTRRSAISSRLPNGSPATMRIAFASSNRGAVVEVDGEFAFDAGCLSAEHDHLFPGGHVAFDVGDVARGGGEATFDRVLKLSEARVERFDYIPTAQVCNAKRRETISRSTQLASFPGKYEPTSLLANCQSSGYGRWLIKPRSPACTITTPDTSTCPR